MAKNRERVNQRQQLRQNLENDFTVRIRTQARIFFNTVYDPKQN